MSHHIGTDPSEGRHARRERRQRRYVRPSVGLATVLAVVGIGAVATGLFRGDFTSTVPVTVLAQRAGLVMNPDAKVKMHGVQVGMVDSVEDRPDGQAAIHLAMDPDQLHLIPHNVRVDITAATAFGAKFVQLVDPPDASTEPMYAGQVINAEHVTVEINTIFQQLTTVLAKIDPAKLNETLGAIATAFNGRGAQLGQVVSDFDALLVKLDPSLQALDHELEMFPAVTNAYADAAPDLLATADNAARISRSIVDEQHNLDAMLAAAIGLADTAEDVVGSNRQALTDVLHLLAPTTDLLNEYHEALYCGLAGLDDFAHTPPLPDPGLTILAGFTMGIERYRYPRDLPKVGATGGPHCKEMMLPKVPFDRRPPYLVTDNGTNPFRYGNQGILLNSDGLKEALFGPLDGPPRNSAQIGQPG